MKGYNIMVNPIRFLLLIGIAALSLNLQAMEDADDAGSLQNFKNSVASACAPVCTVVNAGRTLYKGTVWAIEYRRPIAAAGCMLTAGGTYASYRLNSKIKEKMKRIGKMGVPVVACYLAYKLVTNEETNRLITDSTNTILHAIAELHTDVSNSIARIENKQDQLQQGQRALGSRFDRVEKLLEQQGTEPLAPRERDGLDEPVEVQERPIDVKVEPKTFQGRGNMLTRGWNWLTTTLPSVPDDFMSGFDHDSGYNFF